MSYNYYGFTEYNEKLDTYKFEKVNKISSMYSSNRSPYPALKEFPHVLEDISGFKLFTNQIKELDEKYRFDFREIDIRLLDYKEREDLLNRLIEETLNEKSLKLYKKYTVIKHITD